MPLDDRDQPIHANILQRLFLAAQPTDFDAIDLRAIAQAELQTRTEVALVTPAAVDLGHPFPFTRDQAT